MKTLDPKETCRTGAFILAGLSSRLNGVIRILEAFEDEDSPPERDVLRVIENALGDAMALADDESERLARAAGVPPPARGEAPHA